MKKGLFVFGSDMDGLSRFTGVLELPEDKTGSFAEAIEYLHPKLSSKEFVDRLIEQDCLTDVEYEFESCGYKGYCLEYRFVYSGDVVILKKRIDFVDVF